MFIPRVSSLLIHIRHGFMYHITYALGLITKIKKLNILMQEG